MALKAEEVYAILKKKIESGGATPEQIEQIVADYLTENPPSGMTQEQIQQLNQNTLDILKKLDIDQGKQNAGRILGIGDDGTVSPTDPPSGNGLPEGGLAGEILAKTTNADGDADWVNAPKEYELSVDEEENVLKLNGKSQIPGNVSIDPTLSNENDAAEAKATGEAIKNMEGKSFETAIELYYALRRTGKVYQTKIWKFDTNPTSSGEKMLDNAGLVFEPSTDTETGQDDYLNGQNPLFEWVHVNYVRDADGSPRPTAIEGMEGYQTTGSVDVGAMQMSFWWNWDDSDSEYILVTISDTPHPELNLKPWVECVKADGTILPWCIGSAYISGLASDGTLRSQPNLKPERAQSHNNMITNYQKKGEGYWGAGACRNLFQMIFNIIKGATKNSQNLYGGCTSYNYQYDASIERVETSTYFPVTKSQATNLIVGSCVSVGYAANNAGTLNKDRGGLTVHSYANNVKVLKIEDLDENNSAVYLDIEDGFNTLPIALTEELSAPIMLSTMHWYSGATDQVAGYHDGSPVSNTNNKFPYRVQGREYAVGGYIVASDTVMDFQPDYSKNVYVAPKGTEHVSYDATIRNTYTMLGNIPPEENGADWWIGDISVDMETGSWFPSIIGSGSSQGFGDRCYAGGTTTSGTREYLMSGLLGYGSDAGSAFLNCGHGLGNAGWCFLACD